MSETLILILVFALFMFFMHRGHTDMGRSGGHPHHGHSEAEPERPDGRRHGGGHHPLLMLLVCVLPLFLFFLLLSGGVAISPMFFLLFFILGCVAMFYFMGRAHSADEEAEEPDPVKEEGPGQALMDRMVDVFQARSYRRSGNTLVFEGRLLVEPGPAYDRLRDRFRNTGMTPMLQEGDSGAPQVALVPGPEEEGAGKFSRSRIHLLLFLLTLATTTWAGAAHQGIDLLAEPRKWGAGLPYALALMFILGAHELGHYVAARAHNMKVTLPYFIPVPFALGTFGAFIRMKSTPENRRALFDVGVAGPLAGLAIAVPALLIGLRLSNLILVAPDVDAGMLRGGVSVGSSVLFAFLAKLSLGEIVTEGHQLILHPLAFAGWLGLLLTALNLLPIGQLDGGHIAHALFGRKNSHTIGVVALFSLFLLGLFVWSGLLTWAIIVFLIAGTKSAPPLNDVTKLDGRRVAIGAFAFAVLFLILTPLPHVFYKSLGFHCPYI